MNRLVLPVALLLAAGVAAQQDSATPSGPPAGMALKPIKVYAPAGDRAGQEYDVAAVIGQGPGAILFIHGFSRSVLRPVIGAMMEVDKIADSYPRRASRHTSSCSAPTGPRPRT